MSFNTVCPGCGDKLWCDWSTVCSVCGAEFNVDDLLILHIWRECSSCGYQSDILIDDICPECGEFTSDGT